MLAIDAVPFHIVGGRVLPVWLEIAAAPVVERFLRATRGLEDLTLAEAQAALPSITASVDDQRLSRRVGEALFAIERRRWSTHIDAHVDPEVLRDVVFELAIRLPKEEAIARAAERLAIDARTVVGTLFADRRGRRRLRAPATPTQPIDLVGRYNLAIAQALLLRSMEIIATFRGDTDVVVAAAKRAGLLVLVAREGEITRVSLTGPLALVRRTTKYGWCLARFVPSLVAMPDWSIRARVDVDGHVLLFEVDHTGALTFAAPMPSRTDPRLPQRLARALADHGVHVDPQPNLVPLDNGAVLVTSLALQGPWGRVLIDVVPFATREYLALTMESARQSPIPVVVCIDQRYAHAEVEGARYERLDRSRVRECDRRGADRQTPTVLVYRDEIDPWDLLEKAKSAAGCVSDLRDVVARS